MPANFQFPGDLLTNTSLNYENKGSLPIVLLTVYTATKKYGEVSSIVMTFVEFVQELKLLDSFDSFYLLYFFSNIVTNKIFQTY